MSETRTDAPASTARMVEASGDTVEEAVATALAELAIPREAAEIEVLSEGTKAVPGERISAGLAKVRVRPVDAYAGRAKGLLEELLTLMEIPARVSVRRAVAVRESEAGREPVILDISGDDLGMLIGWRGENLRALQTVVNMLMSKVGADRRVIIDVERYRQRREHTVREIAFRAARQVKVTGDPITLDAMQPFERRAIHLALEDDPDVTTVSVGEEPNRRLVVEPRRASQ